MTNDSLPNQSTLTDTPGPFKRCCACRRYLTYDNFGASKNSPDGYTPNCKNCIVLVRRKAAKRKKTGYPGHIEPRMPLKEHNRQALETALNTNFEESYNLSCETVNEKTPYQLTLTKELKTQKITLIDGGGQLVMQWASTTDTWTSAIESILNFLYEVEIIIERLD